jgi:LysR family transcriptional regulator, regulator for bpeEF and oprC
MRMAGLQSLVAFAETAKRGSFAGAARELALSPSAVAKSVARLEDDLGVRLFHRTTRKVALTSEGHELHLRCRAIVDEFDALRDAAAGARGAPGGTLRINVPITFGKRVIVPKLAALVRQYPGITLDVSFSDRYADIVSEGLDAAVRVGHLADSSLVARRIGEQRLVVVAAPRYLRKRGEPSHPSELATHACMVFRLPTSGRPRPWQFVEGRRRIEWTPDAPVVMNDGEGLAAAAAEGLGLTQVPDYIASADVRAGRLKPVLERFQPPPLPISVVYASARRTTPRLRAMLDALDPASADQRTRGASTADR